MEDIHHCPPLPPPVPQCPDDVPHDIFCGVCHEIATDPALTPCDHMFCRSCILEALSHRPECPCDRRPLEEYRLEPIKGILKRIWESVRVKCPNDGCDWVGTVSNYTAHAGSCGTAVVQAAGFFSALEEELRKNRGIFCDGDFRLEYIRSRARDKEKYRYHSKMQAER